MPLAAPPTEANRRDSVAFEEPVDAVPPIRRPSGRRRGWPSKLYADEAFDSPRCRRVRRRVTVRIARKVVDPARGRGGNTG